MWHSGDDSPVVFLMNSMPASDSDNRDESISHGLGGESARRSEASKSYILCVCRYKSSRLHASVILGDAYRQRCVTPPADPLLSSRQQGRNSQEYMGAPAVEHHSNIYQVPVYTSTCTVHVPVYRYTGTVRSVVLLTSYSYRICSTLLACNFYCTV